MANIPRIKIGNTTYIVKDEIARREQELNRNKEAYNLELENGETTIPFIAGLSTTGAYIDRRMATDFLPITGNFEIYDDGDGGTVSFNVTLYDSLFAEISDVVPLVKARIKRLIFNEADFPTAKYMKIWVCNFTNSDADLTAAQNKYAREHIIFRSGIKVKDKEEYSPNDFQQGRYETDYHILHLDIYTRAASNVFYKNTDDMYPIVNGRNDKVRFYLRYYNSDFQYVDDDSDWCANIMEHREEDYPYFKICISKPTGHDTEELTTTYAREIAANIHLGCPIMKYYSLNPAGEFNKLGDIRNCDSRRIYVKDGYIKCLDPNYSYDIVVFPGATGATEYETGWMNFNSNYGATDKAVRVRDRYISVIFAKIDTTASFSEAEIEELIQKRMVEGTLYSITESVTLNAVSDEVTNGYPLYYDAEAKATVDTICSKLGQNSVKFAMITDLHDNDHHHLSETVQKQVMAIRDINKKNGLDFVICGGDLTDGGYSTKSSLLDKMTDMTRLFKEIGVPVMFVRGNHDDNSYAGLSTNLVVSREEFFARCIAPFTGKAISEGKTYYYQDFDYVNTRIICLDFIDYPWEVEEGSVVNHAAGGDGVWRGYSDEQIVWLLSDALNCNKRIIVTGHYSTHPNLMTSWEKGVDHNYTVVTQAMEAYNSRGSVAFGGQTYSFSGKTGKVIMQVSGHSHSFGAFKDSGIVWSSTGSPSPEVTNRVYDDTQYETMGTRNYGDITEPHFNVFVCDESNVHIISFGQMGDLDFTI